MKLTNGKIRRCHQDQIRKHSVEVPQDSHLEPDIPDIDLPSSEVTVPSTGNTEHSTSETTSMEPSMNADPDHLILILMQQ